MALGNLPTRASWLCSHGSYPVVRICPSVMRFDLCLLRLDCPGPSENVSEQDAYCMPNQTFPPCETTSTVPQIQEAISCFFILKMDVKRNTYRGCGEVALLGSNLPQTCQALTTIVGTRYHVRPQKAHMILRNSTLIIFSMPIELPYIIISALKTVHPLCTLFTLCTQ